MFGEQFPPCASVEPRLDTAMQCPRLVSAVFYLSTRSLRPCFSPPAPSSASTRRMCSDTADPARRTAVVTVKLIKVKVKASHTQVGPGADPGVYAVSLQVTVSHPPGGRLPLLSARPAVTFPAAEHHRRLAGTKLYFLVTEAYRCKQLA